MTTITAIVESTNGGFRLWTAAFAVCNGEPLGVSSASGERWSGICLLQLALYG